MPQTLEERIAVIEHKFAQYEGSHYFLSDQITSPSAPHSVRERNGKALRRTGRSLRRAGKASGYSRVESRRNRSGDRQDHR